MSTLTDTAASFAEMAHRIVWAIGATVDTHGRPTTRVLHPIWEWDGADLTGWILTSPQSPKATHLAANPSLSLTYWTANQDTCTADCATTWDDSDELRRNGWARFAGGPPPVAYDPSIIPGWDSPDSPGFGVLRLAPRTLRVMPGTVMLEGRVEQLLRWQSPRS